MAEEKMGGRIEEWELSCTRKRGVATRGEEWWEDSWTRTTEDARRGRGEWKGSRIRQNHCPQTRNGSRRTNYLQRGNTFSRGKVIVSLSHSNLKRKGHTEGKYVLVAKISRKQIEVSSRKNSIGKNADALAFKEISRSLLKVDKSQKIGNQTCKNCYIAHTAMNTALLLKKWK